MFEIKCCVNRINYDSTLQLLSPVFQKYHIPMLVGKAALFIMSEAKKQELLISLIKKNDIRILSILQEVINKKNISLDLKEISINERVGKMIEIKLAVDNVNYESIVELILPVLCDSIKEKKELSFLNELMANAEISKNVISATLNAIPDEMKTNLILSAAECYNDKILEMLKDFVIKKGIKIDIDKVSIKNIEC